jgi:hypothetical protein
MNKFTAIICAGLLTVTGSALAGESVDESTNPNSGTNLPRENVQQKPDGTGAGGDIQQQRMQDSADKDEYKNTDSKDANVQKLRQKADGDANKRAKTNTKESMIKGKEQKHDASEGGVDVSQ